MKLWWDRGTEARPGVTGWMNVMSYSAHLDCSRDRLLFHLMYPLGLSLRLNLHLVFNFLCIPESAGEH